MLGTHKKSPPRFPKAGSLVTELLAFAPRRVRLPCEFFEGAKERAGLADEQSVVNEGLNSAHGCTLGFCWPDDRHRRELFAQEDGRLRHDEVGLEIVGVGIRVQVSKHKVAVGNSGSIACLVMPSLEVSGFGGPDTQENAQDFGVSDALGERGIETAAALLDESEVEAGGVGDGLKVIGNTVGAGGIREQIRILERNGGVLSDGKTGHGLREGGAGGPGLRRTSLGS